MGNVSVKIESIKIPIDFCWNCTARRVKYVRELEENIDDLKIACEELKELRDDVMTRVEIAEESQQMKRLKQVEGWFSRVEAMEAEANELIVESSQEIEKKCPKNCISSYKLGKKVARVKDKVVALKSKGVFEEVANRLPSARVDERPNEPLVGLMFDEVWRYSEDEQLRIIGLYGVGGVGKTTHLIEINNTAGMESMFNEFSTHIEDEQVRIIGLYGVGGVGKTTLLTEPIVVRDPAVKAIPKEREFEQLEKSFARLVDLATNKNSQKVVYVVVDPEVFRTNDHNSKPISEILVARDDLLHLKNFIEIELPIMQLYMCTLYNRAKELGVTDSIRFAIPAGACGKHGKSNSEDLYYIMETASVDCIFLYPYNTRYHWVLAVINPGKRHMWYFDPLANAMHPKLLETLKRVFKSLDYSDNFGSSKRSPVFEIAICPKQTGTVECGYYVMRYMKDIVESHGTLPSSLFLSRTPYKIDLIDAVRAELMSFTRDNMH